MPGGIALPPGTRTRRLRHRIHRRHRRRTLEPCAALRHPVALQPRPPGCARRRCQNRRRRGPADAASLRHSPPGGQPAGTPPLQGRRPRRGLLFPAARQRLRAGAGESDCGGGAGIPRPVPLRVARGADEHQRPRRQGSIDHAAHRAGAHRQTLGHEPGRVRAQVIPRPQRDREARRRRQDQEFLRLVDVQPGHRLQGPARFLVVGEFLPRSVEPGLRDGALHLPSALQHEHLPDVAARAAFPDAGPQRRDQHRQGQPQLDARPRGGTLGRLLGRRHRPAQTHYPAGRLGQREPGQRARSPRHERARHPPCDDDARALRVARQPGGVAGTCRVLRIPRLLQRALGRSGGAGVQRRQHGRRVPGPERPASGALQADRRRDFLSRLGGGRGGVRRRARHRKRTAWARRNDRRRYGQ